MAKVFWNAEERLVLANERLRVYGYGPLPEGKKDYKVIDELQAKVLPKNRQRKFLSTTASVKPVLDLIDKLRAEGPPPKLDRLVEPEKVELDLYEERISGWPKPEPEFTFVPEGKRVEPETTVTEVLSDFIAGVLVESVKKLLTNGEISRMLTSLAAGQMPTISREIVPKHSPTGSRGPRKIVLLCGVRPFEQAQFLQKFPHLHLRFWFSELTVRGADTLKAKAENAELVIVKAGQVDPAGLELLNTMKKRVVLVTGDMSAMIAAVEKVNGN